MESLEVLTAIMIFANILLVSVVVCYLWFDKREEPDTEKPKLVNLPKRSAYGARIKPVAVDEFLVDQRFQKDAERHQS